MKADSKAVDAIIIPSGDSHQSEYVASCDERRAYISGFTGSAGTALVLQTRALLWTDGRYFLQAINQLSSDWTLMKSGEPGVLSMEDWLADNLQFGQRVGVDGNLLSGAAARTLMQKLAVKGITLIPLESNLVDDVWSDRPLSSKDLLRFHPVEIAGECIADKHLRVQTKIRAAQADAAVFSMLDEIMWLYNIRGNDIAYNPLVKSYAIVTANGGAHLFIDAKKIPETAGKSPLECISIHPYDDISLVLGEMARDGIIFLVDNSQLSWRLCDIIDKSSNVSMATVNLPSPIALLKSVKNDTELKGVRDAHDRDGIALTAFLAWLDKTIRGGGSLTECEAADKLEEFRKKMPYWVSPSFATISGYGPNAAIIHYHAQPETCNSLGIDSVYLLDSGAQYLDGTTDVTRTVHFGVASDRIKMCYTYVLKGHIALGSAVFPEGTVGSRLDSLARLPLWGAGLDYNHGTGHGVGAFLNVHEGPQGIGFRPRANEAGFCAGMTTSNEPGYYEHGEFGIRIENICITVPANTPNNFADRKFCKFETVTMCPIETSLIDYTLMNPEEIRWLNSYHEKVRETLLPGIQETFPEAMEYLLQKTEAVKMPLL